MVKDTVTISTSTGRQYEMPGTTWDAIGILVRAHYQLMNDMLSCSARKADKARTGAEMLTRIIKRMKV